jgi:hypothetical protein
MPDRKKAGRAKRMRNNPVAGPSPAGLVRLSYFTVSALCQFQPHSLDGSSSTIDTFSLMMEVFQI